MRPIAKDDVVEKYTSPLINSLLRMRRGEMSDEELLETLDQMKDSLDAFAEEARLRRFPTNAC